MASPRPPPPPSAPVIKERTRALHDKLKRRAAQADQTASLNSSAADVSTEFPVIQSDTHGSTAAAGHTSSTASQRGSPLVSADTAIARLRTYRDEQLLWHTAVEHFDKRTLLTIIGHWRQAVSNNPPSLSSITQQASRAHRLHSLRSAIDRWRGAVQTSRQYRQQHGHLARFHSRHLQRTSFIAWVAHTLHRKDKEAGALLAQSLHRSNALRETWRLWRETAVVAARQRGVEKRAEQHATTRLMEDALAVWLAQGSQAAREREKEGRAVLYGDRLCRRFYLRRWRQLPVEVRKDQQAAPRVTQRAQAQTVRDAWRAWREEAEWRHAAQLATDRAVKWTEQWLVRAAWVGWEEMLEREEEDKNRLQQAATWHCEQQQLHAIARWRANNRDAKVNRARDKHLQLERMRAVECWRAWAHHQRLARSAQLHYDNQSLVQLLWWWRQQLQLCVSDRLMQHKADTRDHESRMVSALRQWHNTAQHQRQDNARVSTAQTHHTTRQLNKSMHALLSNRESRRMARQHASLVRHHQLQSAVITLHQHAAYQRHYWQLHLRAKRHRYFHLLRATWHSWHDARRREAAADERLFDERCAGLVHEWRRRLFAAWLGAASERRVARQRQVVALQHWSGRLAAHAWQEWQIAVLDRADEQRIDEAADASLQRFRKRRALRSWLSHARYRRQVREAESEAVEAGRQQLAVLCRRRAWRALQLAFHASRAHRLDLANAAGHHTRHRLHHAVDTWRATATASAHRGRLRAAALQAHGRRLLLAAWRHWLAIQRERRRLLALHVRALQWRRAREERRVWAAWRRWVHGRRARRQREADMRRLRVERLQVEGVRQWVMVGMDWLQQKAELEIEARRQRQDGERAGRERQRYVQEEAVERWVQRIAAHWRHRIARKEESRQPLITHEQLSRWRREQSHKTQPPQPSHIRFIAAGEDGRPLRYEVIAAHPPVDPDAVSWASASLPPTTVIPRPARVRLQPRQHVELLLLDDPLAPPVAELQASSTSRAQLSASAVVQRPRADDDTYRPLQTSSQLSSGVISNVDEALLAALSAPAGPSLDVSAAESRLQFLAGMRSAYAENKRELERMQQQPAPHGMTEAPHHANSAANAERLHLLLHACLEFEQQRAEWKREVQEWQTTIRRAQMSSG